VYISQYVLQYSALKMQDKSGCAKSQANIVVLVLLLMLISYGWGRADTADWQSS